MEINNFKLYVRPVIAFAITGMVVWLGVKGEIEANTIIAIFGTIAGFYFGQDGGK